MLPSIVAREIREGVLDYLRTTFHLRDKDYERALFDFIGDEQHGMFRGPFFEAQVPFQSTGDSECSDILDITPPFAPHKHQREAWSSLSSKDNNPQHTLVTTGTGSGKSEAFLVPLLDHCYRNRQKKGVKALILYPMNALAADQAKRIAELIHDNDKLKHNNIRAAIYTGDRESSRKSMGADHLIENQKQIREQPPDILLTNYKMLDYLLLRDQDLSIWQNTAAEALQYIVIDELHTFDGAQGTDVAMLLRRLRALDAVSPSLTAVGTSATLGSGDSTLATRKLRSFAREVFGIGSDETIHVVTETRQPASNYLLALQNKLDDIFGQPTVDSEGLAEASVSRQTGDAFGQGEAWPRILSVSGNPEISGDIEDVPSSLGDNFDPVRSSMDTRFFEDIHTRLLGCPPLSSSKVSAGGETTGDTREAATYTHLRTDTRALIHHPLFEPVVHAASGITSATELAESLCRIGTWGAGIIEDDDAEQLAGQWNQIVEAGLAHNLLECFVALISMAELRADLLREILNPPRKTDAAQGNADNENAGNAESINAGEDLLFGERILETRTHLWVRELRGMGRRIRGPFDQGFPYEFTWNEENPPGAIDARPVHCRSCGAHAVAAATDDTNPAHGSAEELSFKFHETGRRWNFANKGARVVAVDQVPETSVRGSIQQFNVETRGWHRVNPEDVTGSASPEADKTASFSIATTSYNPESEKFEAKCPYCSETGSMMFTSARSTMLNSVMITSDFQSLWSGEPRLLSFVDSVQDATHRAGYFSSRTYGFLLRSAFERAIQTASPTAPLPLDQLGERTLETLEADGNRTTKELIANMMPPDLEGWELYKKFLDAPSVPSLSEARQDPQWRTFIDKLSQRISLEGLLEFGQYSDRGRTLIASACALVEVDDREVDALAQRIADIFEEEPPKGTATLGLSGVDDGQLTDPAVLKGYIYGIIEYLRTRGALDHPLYRSFLKNNGNGYLLSKSHLFHIRPGLARKTPKFISSKTNHKHLTSFVGRANTSTWLQDYTQRTFRLFNPDVVTVRDILERIFKVMAHQASDFETEPLMITETPDGKSRHETIYGLNTAALRVIDAAPLIDEEGPVKHELKCTADDCSTRVFAAPDELQAREGNVCPRRFCKGHLERTPVRKPDYYSRLYRRRHFERVIATEHTGILDKEKRQYIEDSFSRPAHEVPGSPNVIVATPTLEMGIDIGNLDAVLLSSTPRTRASMKQRFGRAGRKKKQALVMHTATVRTWDLHVFSDPLTQLRGDVEPPRLFLEARDMLRRQFFAFAISDWIRADKSRRLPIYFKQIREAWATTVDHSADKGEASQTSRSSNTRSTEGDSHKQFVPGFFGYFEEHAERIYDTFRALLHRGTDVSVRLLKDDEDTVEDLIRNLQEALYERLAAESNAIREYGNDIERIRRVIRDRKREIQTKDYEQDDVLAELKAESDTAKAAQRRLRNQKTLDALHRYAMLPNYAFPEEAVEFHSRIWSSKKQSGEFNRETTIVEAQRSPSRALRELAPGSKFFYDGYIHGIEGVDTLRGRAIETHYFCQKCTWRALKSGADSSHASCPRCQGPIASETMVQMRGARGNANRFSSRVDDSTEDRAGKSYELRWLTNYEHTQELRYRSEDQAFIFGYADRAELMEVNFGEPRGNIRGRTLGGETINAQPFVVCPYCGQAQVDRNKGINHRYHCQHKRKKLDETAEINLYRQLYSETIRIQLPLNVGRTTASFASLKAALRSGMAQRWGDDVSHVELIESFVPWESEHSGKGPTILVMADTIPGGTGMLKDLFDSDGSDEQEADSPVDAPFAGLREVIDEASAFLMGCECNDIADDAAGSELASQSSGEDRTTGDQSTPDVARAGSDGCFRCIRRYASPWEMDVVSRKLALEQLQELKVALKSGKLEELPEDWSPNIGGSAFDSALERETVTTLVQTIKALGGTVDKEPSLGSSVQKIGIPSSEDTEVRFNTKQKDGDSDTSESKRPELFEWRIRPQVDLTGTDGYDKISSRPDLLIEPLGALRSKHTPSIAVYIDGYEFHVQPHKPTSRLHDDFRKRRALMAGSYERPRSELLVWSAGYHDLEEFRKNDHPDVMLVPSAVAVTAPLGSVEARKNYKTDINPFSLLLRFLRDPDLNAWREQITGELSERLLDSSVRAEDMAPSLSELTDDTEHRSWKVAHDLSGQETPGIHAQGTISSNASRLGLEFEISIVGGRQIPQNAAGRARLLDSHPLRESDDYQPVWREFLQATNWLQFLPDAQIAIGENDDYELFAAVYDLASSATEDVAAKPEPKWPLEDWQREGYADLFSAEQLTLLDKAEQNDAPCPMSFEFTLESNADALAPIAWPEQHVVFLEAKPKHLVLTAFRDAGFTVVSPEAGFMPEWSELERLLMPL